MPPEGSGVASIYNDEHLNRILLIKKLQAEYMPLNKIREYILGNPAEKVEIKPQIIENITGKDIYIKENICNIFDIHYSQENLEKYGYIIENVKKYVQKMIED